MRSLKLSVIGGLLIVTMCVWGVFPVQAQSGEAAKIGEDLVSLDVQDKPLTDIIEGIIEQTQANIDYDEDKIGDVYVTIKLVNVPWRAALRTICDKYKCLMTENQFGVISVTKPPEVTMELEGADIRDVINYIAQVANENIVLSEQVKGKVSLRLKNVPWQDALQTIIKNSGYVLVQEKGGIYRVVPPEEIQTQLETKVFQLKYIRPKSSYVAKMSSATSHFSNAAQQQKTLQQQIQQGGQGTGGIQVSQFSLLTALQGVITMGKGKITYDETTNTLIITDTRPKIDTMEEIIRELDREPKQVFIDLKFVRTTNTDVFDFGVDIGDNGVRISQTLGSMTTRFPFTLGRAGFEEAIAAAPDGQELPNPANLPSDGGITFGSLDFSSTSFVLRLLKRDVKSKIIQAPKLVTLDHHEATIFVGRSIAFAESEIQQNDNGTVSIELREAQNSPAQEGFQMLVVPHILQETSKIQLTMIISNDQLTGRTSTTVPGFNQFNVAGASIDLPESTRQIIVTHMILESGQTAVLGGLMSINQSETVNKVPFLGDIPFIGYAFKNKSIQKNKEDLFIFLTPRIVQSAEVTKDRQEAIVQEKKDKFTAEYHTIWQDKTDAKTENTKKNTVDENDVDSAQ